MSITNRVHHIVSVAGVSPHLGKLFIREIILLILPDTNTGRQTFSTPDECAKIDQNIL